ncbi:cysteine-rich CWC family protein [Thalassotalea profundi]|uniref:Cysteine-rich CWC family protein n=1 Tax=Thalassotalea profundi TaxID=2036687 RepID=A0ABQ3J3F4_9GAMM|nr:cysteine-rich CWC family protein [Thalassotalea profundi]GHE97632.1 hypothetical protein GCM10011501_29070 [Thalassotalea profundi]
MSDMSQNSDKEIDDTTCPLCRNKNLCQAHQPGECWCYSAEIPQDVIDMVEPQFKRKSCICQSCIERYNLALAVDAYK